jgi:hypothetical protein
MTSSTFLTFREEALLRIRQGTTFAAQSSWAAVLELSTEVADLDELVLRHWPTNDPTAAIRIISAINAETVSEAAVRVIRSSQWAAGPSAVLSLSEWLERYRESWPDGTTAARLLIVPPELINSRLRANSTIESLEFAILERGLSATVLSLGAFNGVGSIEVPEKLSPELASKWSGFASVVEFIRGIQSREALASALRGIQRAGIDGHNVVQAPWVLESVLQDHFEGLQLDQLADEAIDGRFGDTKDWYLAEARWDYGLTTDDFMTWTDCRYVTSSVGAFGSPYISTFARTTIKADVVEAIALLKGPCSILPPEKAITLLNAVMFAWTSSADYMLSKEIGAAIRSICVRSSACHWPRLVTCVAHLFPDGWDIREFVFIGDAVGKSSFPALAPDTNFERAVLAFNSDVRRRGLLSFIASGRIGMLNTNRLGNSTYLGQVDNSAFANADDDTVSVQKAVAVLQLYTGRWADDDIARIVSALCGCGDPSERELDALLSCSTLFTHPTRNALVVALAMRMLETGADSVVTVLQHLASASSARRSGLYEGKAAVRLRLPSLPETVPRA